jgi:amidase
MTETAFMSATALADAIRQRRIGVVELLEAYRERIERFNPELNAVVTTDFEAARHRAQKADEALSRGESWGVLHGLPLTVKDSFETEGLVTTGGSAGLKNHRPAANASVVQAVIDQGAIVFGKSNLPLFAMDFQSYNDVFGRTNNPWQLDRVPGGSSGGAAAAVAAGLTSFEIGSDIGGSIRTPAHFCGIYGHKPSWGIIPSAGHIPPPPGLYPGEYVTQGDLAVFGPMARSAEDLALLMKVMVSPSVPDRIAGRIALPEPRYRRLQDFRIGLWLDDPACPVDVLVGDRIQSAIDRLAGAGAQLSDRRPAIDFKRCFNVFSLLMHAAASATLPPKVYNRLVEEAKGLQVTDSGPRARLLRGATQSHRDWQLLDYERLLMRQAWADYFKEVDLLLCPVAPITAFAHDHSEFFDRTLTVNGSAQPYLDVLLGWAGLVGAVYLPSTVIPLGTARNGLPVGLQVVGPFLEDLTPIHAAGLIAEVIGGFSAPPDHETK